MFNRILTYFILCCCFRPVLTAQDLKVEPPYWWADMQRSQIELLLYYPKVKQAKLQSSGGLKINAVKTGDSENYLFVEIDTRGLAPGTYEFTLQWPDGKKRTHAYELKARKLGSASRKGFGTEDVLYLIMPDRFSNGNPENDSHPEMKEQANRDLPGGRHGGDIEGIIQQLDYLQDLGVTSLWCTPLCEDNDPTYSYHGYAQSDVYRIDPRYGSNDDYRRLSDALHTRGMKLIKDYVTNHWGAEHWMIQDLPMYDWINQHPGYAQSNYRMTTQFDPYTTAIDKKMCVDGWFVKTMPDLNQRNPHVLNYLIQNAIWWIEYADLDGLRVDTYSYNDKDGIAVWTKAIMDEYPNFNIVGEVWMHQQAHIAYWQKDSPLAALQNYNAQLPAVMDFTLHDAIMLAFNEDEPSWDKGMIRVYENFVSDFLYSDPENLLVFMENHDTERINELFNSDFGKYKLALTLILTTRGIPQLYYGSEIGMRGKKSLGDADIRRDFPGGWQGDNQNAFMPDSRTADQEQWHTFTKGLLQFRKRSKAIQQGNLLHYLPQNNIYVFFRNHGREKVMVLLNNSPKEHTIDFKHYAEGLGETQRYHNVLTGQKGHRSENIRINAKDILILEWKE